MTGKRTVTVSAVAQVFSYSVIGFANMLPTRPRIAPSVELGGWLRLSRIAYSRARRLTEHPRMEPLSAAAHVAGCYSYRTVCSNETGRPSEICSKRSCWPAVVHHCTGGPSILYHSRTRKKLQLHHFAIRNLRWNLLMAICNGRLDKLARPTLKQHVSIF